MAARASQAALAGNEFGLGDLGVAHPGAQLAVPDGPGVFDRGPGVLADGRDRRPHMRVHLAVTEKNAPARRTADVNAAE